MTTQARCIVTTIILYRDCGWQSLALHERLLHDVVKFFNAFCNKVIGRALHMAIIANEMVSLFWRNDGKRRGHHPPTSTAFRRPGEDDLGLGLPLKDAQCGSMERSRGLSAAVVVVDLDPDLRLASDGGNWFLVAICPASKATQ